MPRESHPQALRPFNDTGNSGDGHYGGVGPGSGGDRDDDASAGVVQGSTRGGGAHFTAALDKVRGGGQAHENGPGGVGVGGRGVVVV